MKTRVSENRLRVPFFNSHFLIRNSAFRRPAFTLVEILTVIVIIGILVGLLVGAVGPVRNMARNWKMKSEIVQLSQALERVRNELGGGEYPADGSDQNVDMPQFLRRAFPRCPESNYPSNLATLTGTPASALLFWLGGMQDPTTGVYIGFSSNPLNPFDTSAASGARIGPFYDFDRSRLSKDDNKNPIYLPQNDMPTSQPFLYFKALAGAYPQTASLTVNSKTVQQKAYLDYTAMGRSESGPDIWMNPTSYQLMCPGLDGIYGDPDKSQGITSGRAPHYPDGDNYCKGTFDDITNFTQKAKLESDMP